MLKPGANVVSSDFPKGSHCPPALFEIYVVSCLSSDMFLPSSHHRGESMPPSHPNLPFIRHTRSDQRCSDSFIRIIHLTCPPYGHHDIFLFSRQRQPKYLLIWDTRMIIMIKVTLPVHVLWIGAPGKRHNSNVPVLRGNSQRLQVLLLSGPRWKR
jgi:hypothetical protein